jgi:uncharacterized membrane protein YcaP (DUF421 family)
VWLDSGPLGPAELRGRVVLVSFWTWTCINWLRPELYVRAWSQAYRNDALVVIGVHTVANAMQNGITGDDDSVTGGVLGASALLVLNGALAVLFRRSKLRRLALGTPRTLISMGVVDHEALRRERLTEDQLMAAIATQGAGGLDDVAQAVLVPNGTIVTRMKEMDRDARRLMDLTKQLDELKPMVAGLGPASAGPQRSA